VTQASQAGKRGVENPLAGKASCRTVGAGATKVCPQQYFEAFDFAESLVQRIVYESGIDRLEFVVAYMGHDGITVRDPSRREPSNQDAPWDFRRLLFCHVAQLRRDDCRYKKGFRGFDPADFSFSPVKTSLTPCIEFAHVRKI